MSTIKITKENFNEQVINSNKPILLDFWATWCAPCRMVAPILDESASERTDIKVGKVNVDEQEELVSKFDIMSIPTLVAIKDGKIIGQAVGVRPKEQIFALFRG